jgi:hypothetical protein
MNVKTRRELNKLADVMIKNHNIEQIIGTDGFLNTAYREADKNSIGLSNQSIRKYSGWLESKCQSENGGLFCMATSISRDAEDDIIMQAAEIIARRRAQELEADDEEDDDGLFSGDINSIFNLPKQKVYTIFDEVEGEIIITRGAYSKPPFEGKTPKQINEMRGWPCMPGWADGILSANEKLGPDRYGALTQDDIEVLEKIKKNQI